jgi:hypothetical protein
MSHALPEPEMEAKSVHQQRGFAAVACSLIVILSEVKDLLPLTRK